MGTYGDINSVCLAESSRNTRLHLHRSFEFRVWGAERRRDDRADIWFTDVWFTVRHTVSHTQQVTQPYLVSQTHRGIQYVTIQSVTHSKSHTDTASHTMSDSKSHTVTHSHTQSHSKSNTVRVTQHVTQLDTQSHTVRHTASHT